MTAEPMGPGPAVADQISRRLVAPPQRNSPIKALIGVAAAVVIGVAAIGASSTPGVLFALAVAVV